MNSSRNNLESFFVSDKDVGIRLDVFLQEKYPDISRNQIQHAIKFGRVRNNNILSKSSCKLKAGDEVQFDKSFIDELSKPIEIVAEKIPLNIIYEDNNVIAIDKPAGLVVHPAHGNQSGTLVNALINRNPEIISAIDKNSVGSDERPGIVHRLDKDTSGIILVAKNKKSLSSLTRQLAAKNIKKKYAALVLGETPEEETIENFIGREKFDRKKMAETSREHGKLAITNYRAQKYFDYKDKRLSLLEIDIPTGRTHQIRVHMKGAGYPIIGDQTYYTKESKEISELLGAKRQMLHATEINFYLPGMDDRTKLKSDLPDDFKKLLKTLS